MKFYIDYSKTVSVKSKQTYQTKSGSVGESRCDEEWKTVGNKSYLKVNVFLMLWPLHWTNLVLLMGRVLLITFFLLPLYFSFDQNVVVFLR